MSNASHKEKRDELIRLFFSEISVLGSFELFGNYFFGKIYVFIPFIVGHFLNDRNIRRNRALLVLGGKLDLQNGAVIPKRIQIDFGDMITERHA